jgi:hypothetical protein
MSTINDHLIKDYYKVYSEPHRRYPTTFKWPGLIYHIALYVNSEKSISNKLNNNNKQRIDGNITSEPEEADNSVFESVVEHLRDNFYWRRPFKFESESKAPQSHEIVKFETEPANYLITRTSNFNIQLYMNGQGLIKGFFLAPYAHENIHFASLTKQLVQYMPYVHRYC